MEKEFVPYELAVKLKALGFDGFTRFHINRNNELNTISESPFSMFQYNMEPNEDDTDSLVAAPTFSQAFRWFREKYRMFHEVFIDTEPTVDEPDKLEFTYIVLHMVGMEEMHTSKNKRFKTYEEAELACLDKLLEIVESESK